MICLVLPLSAQDKGNVGMVKRLKVNFPGELLTAAKVDDKADAMVRIISYKKEGDGFSYDLEFIGLEPGKYNLLKYMRTAASLDEVSLEAYPVEVGTVLSPDFNGELVDFQKDMGAFKPWYKKLNYLLIAFWVLLLPTIVFFGRKRKKEEDVVEVKEKTLNEKICELLISLEGNSTKELWQKIEGLILKHWYEKKSLQGLPMHEAIMKLKSDSEAGPFILKLEKGLHSKEFKNEHEVAELIKKISKEGAAA
jgi:hypothetical protein